MSDQQELAWTAAQRMARRTDPHTSHEAAAEHVASGGRGRQHRKIMDTMSDHWIDHIMGYTATELEDRTGIRCHRRMKELERLGLVRRGEPRICTVTGRRATTWRLA